jgi:hypothetical protein
VPKRITGSGAEKSSRLFPQSPVPQTDTGGWVEYTKARERNLSKELGINSLVTSEEEVPPPFGLRPDGISEQNQGFCTAFGGSQMEGVSVKWV